MIFVQPLSHSQKLFLSGRVAGLAVGCKKYLAPRGGGVAGQSQGHYTLLQVRWQLCGRGR